MSERYQPDDTQPIGVRSTHEQPGEVACHFPVTTPEGWDSHASVMTYEPLIEQALTEPGRNERLVQDRMHPLRTLSRPITEFDSWRSLVLIGTHGEWNPSLAIKTLGVEQVPYEPRTESLHGYASGNTFAIAPNTSSPLRTLKHELGHFVMGHTFYGPRRPPEKALREVQAEVVAFCCQALIGALTPESMAVSKNYIHSYYQQLSAPLAESDYVAMNAAIGTILAAGK